MAGASRTEPNDHGYSPDFEIDHLGRIIALRDFKDGEAVRIPLHMANRICRGFVGSRGL